MGLSVWVVVGNNYSEFANNDWVATFDQLQGISLAPGDVVVLGQGLTQAQRSAVIALGARGISVEADQQLCPRRLTHKALVDNILVTEPERVEELIYRSMLVVGDEEDRLLDHVTGQHLNGMLLIEAARQAGIAAIEKHYLENDARSWGFSWTRCDSQFLDLAFPVPTEIYSHLPHISDFESVNQAALPVPMTILQRSVKVAEVMMEVTVISRDLAGKLEKRRAKRCAAEVVSKYAQSVPMAQIA